MVKAFTHNSVNVYEPFVGGKFALFDSNISGEFIELVTYFLFIYFLFKVDLIKFIVKKK